jgi:CRISPR system Cascade subunit CasE
LSKNSRNSAGEAVTPNWIGKRVPVPLDESHLRAWLENRAEPQSDLLESRNTTSPGFRLLKIESIETGSVRFNKSRNPKNDQRLVLAEYEGILETTDTENFRNTIITGIGSAKAFGFGLLSLAPG